MLLIDKREISSIYRIKLISLRIARDVPTVTGYPSSVATFFFFSRSSSFRHVEKYNCSEEPAVVFETYSINALSQLD